MSVLEHAQITYYGHARADIGLFVWNPGGIFETEKGIIQSYVWGIVNNILPSTFQKILILPVVNILICLENVYYQSFFGLPWRCAQSRY